jgi:sugar lactone lactonase YvrE
MTSVLTEELMEWHWILKVTLLLLADGRLSGPGPMICVFDEKGRILMSERTPCMRPSNLAFGGENLEDIYITSLEGHLYRVKNTGLKGNPLP